jgi:hypothetical protein
MLLCSLSVTDHKNHYSQLFKGDSQPRGNRCELFFIGGELTGHLNRRACIRNAQNADCHSGFELLVNQCGWHASYCVSAKKSMKTPDVKFSLTNNEVQEVIKSQPSHKKRIDGESLFNLFTANIIKAMKKFTR